MKKYKMLLLISILSSALCASTTTFAKKVKFINATNIPQQGSSEICEPVTIYGHNIHSHPGTYTKLAVLQNCASGDTVADAAIVDLADYDIIEIIGSKGTKPVYYDRNHWPGNGTPNGSEGHLCMTYIHMSADTQRKLFCTD